MQDLAPPIDAVITWVDGSDPDHAAKRQARLGKAENLFHPNGTNPHRWDSRDELTYCLTSIANHAPWIRHVWLVTDNQRPDLSRVPSALLQRLSVVDHTVIFAGFEHALPTFNSLSIETVIWRIPGLADSFLYFNDDVFLTAPLNREDVFRGKVPVLRGKWVDYSAIAEDVRAMQDPAMFNHFTQMTAARLAGFAPRRMWASAHVVHPLRRPLLAELFARFNAESIANLSHQFRDLRQFQPMALHNHEAIRARTYATPATKDYRHLRTGAVIDFPRDEVRAYLRRSTSGESKFLCINDFPQLEAFVPETRKWIERAIGA